MSNFCLSGWIFVLEYASIKPWKITYLNNLHILRHFLNVNGVPLSLYMIHKWLLLYQLQDDDGMSRTHKFSS